MSPFSRKHIRNTIDRLPTLSDRDVGTVRERARERGLVQLIEACDAELSRRPFVFSSEAAKSFEEMARGVRDMELIGAIRYAFTQVRPPADYETEVLRWIAAHPGGSYQDALHAYGKRDLGLVIGHLVYDRYGCFRKPD
jgi:hypothetical protein